ncbi:carbohydrate ABC transporter permease [Palleronia caenipelagi]|uniref:carbohydrate ABC transporter permease n=1 Tax=Palleronia caenipelagi TaxID=2489174 RepID=UPI00163D6C4B|nr:carbohydrate ABC transporter permease [Palleronia caenipelagi]
MKPSLRSLTAHGVIGLALVVFLFPFYWLVITAFKNEGENFRKPPTFWPSEVTLDNFRAAITGSGSYQGVSIESTSVLYGIRDSIIVAGCNTLLSVVLGLFAAYAISRFRTGGQHLSFFILSNRFLPPIVFVVPMFIILRTVGMLDTYIGLILVYLTFNLPFATWYLLAYMKDLPVEVEEAAMMDGCTRLGVVFRIIMPLAAPGMAVTGLFCFVFAWNEYTLAFLLAGNDVTTLTVMLPQFAGSVEVLKGVVSAAAILACIPAVFLAMAMQKFMAASVTQGAYR